MSKKVLIITLIVVIAGFIFVGLKFIKSKPNNAPQDHAASQTTPDLSDKKANLISTNPDFSNDPIIEASQKIEITFDKPLENSGELKMKIDPKPDYKVELSSDRKTAQIKPVKPYELGLEYSISISPESKFDNGARLSEGKNFHFRTVKYRGFN